VNLAGLLMARGVGRSNELAVRAALGASASRLVRQLVIESGVLAFFGGVAGLAMAYWATPALVALSGGAFTAAPVQSIRLDATTLFFTCAVSAATALAFGLWPARHATHIDPQDALRDRARGITSGQRPRRPPS